MVGPLRAGGGQGPLARSRSAAAPGARASPPHGRGHGPSRWPSNSSPEPVGPAISGSSKWSERPGGGTLPSMGTPLATFASRPGRRTAATLALLLPLLVGCDAAAGTPAQPVEGLLVLTKGDSARLDVLAAKRDPNEAVAINVPLAPAMWPGSRPGTTGSSSPAPATATSPRATRSIRRGSAAEIAGLEWTPVEATDDAGASLTEPARFGSLGSKWRSIRRAWRRPAGRR